MATTVVGTPIYMAPEVLIKEFRSSGNGYDERADMWSMAVILYQMVFGTHPLERAGSFGAPSIAAYT